MLVRTHEEFKRDPAGSYADICAFMGQDGVLDGVAGQKATINVRSTDAGAWRLRPFQRWINQTSRCELLANPALYTRRRCGEPKQVRFRDDLRRRQRQSGRSTSFDSATE